MQDIIGRLSIPGMPEWTGLVALLLLLLAGIAYLLMPFSVFGLKGRLESIEAQLDELQAELRNLALRQAGGHARTPTDDWLDAPAAPPAPAAAPRADRRDDGYTAPIPPPAAWPEQPSHGRRSEPRVDWPRQR